MEYNLQNDMLSDNDINSVIELLKSKKQLTMSTYVKKFEDDFAKYLNVPYAVMVNSGSSANLLAFSAITNFDSENKLNLNDEILVPSVCWSTSLWPIIQSGLIPKLVDVKPDTLEIDINDLVKKISIKTKAILLVHIIGTCSNMNEIMEIVKKYNLILIEDSCECLGTTYNNKFIGTFGRFSTFSFYFSHHITTIEGGMVVCHTLNDYNLLKCLRSHGWSRDQSNKSELENIYNDIDPRFLFINIGFNLRPTEINGLLGILQLEKLNYFNNIRISNYNKITNYINTHPKNLNLLKPITINSMHINVAWFAIPIFINSNYSLKEYTKFLNENKIFNRPIISGNFCRQPSLKKLGFNFDIREFPGSETIHNFGFYIGLSCLKIISDSEIENLVDIMLSDSFWKK